MRGLMAERRDVASARAEQMPRRSRMFRQRSSLPMHRGDLTWGAAAGRSRVSRAMKSMTLPPRAAALRIRPLPDVSSLPVALLSLATAVPDTMLAQDEAREVSRRLFGGRAGHFEKLAPVFDNAGI